MDNVNRAGDTRLAELESRPNQSNEQVLQAMLRSS